MYYYSPFFNPRSTVVKMETLKSKALLVVVIIILQIQNCIATSTEEDCIKVGITSIPICIPSNYSKYDYPTLKKLENHPTNIVVDFFGINILKVNDYDSTVSIILALQLQWLDPRLEFGMDSEADYREFIPLPKIFSDKLWMPDLTIMGVNTLEKHDLIGRKSDENLVLVNGTYVAYGREIEVSIYCPMNFDHYPMDSHNCPFRLFR